MVKKSEKPEGKFSFLVPAEAIPARVYPSALDNTPLKADMDTLTADIRSNGVSPSEIKLEIPIAKLKATNKDGKPLKNIALTLKTWLREYMKKQGLDKELGVVTRGDRFFIVGKGAE